MGGCRIVGSISFKAVPTVGTLRKPVCLTANYQVMGKSQWTVLKKSPNEVTALEAVASKE